MKTHWTEARSKGEKPTVSLSRMAILSRLSIMCAAWMCVVSATAVHAQSNSEGLQQAGGFSSADASAEDGMIQHGDQSYRVVDTASYRTAADAGSTESSDIEQVGYSGNCSSCGTSSCGGSCGTLSMQTGSCGSCGTSCGGSKGRCGLGLGSICSSNRQSGLSCGGALSGNGPCAPCSPYRYASVEALYMQRDDVSFNRNGTLPLPDFDYEFGPRIVVGAVYDCVNGYESSLVGPFSWDASNSLPALRELAPSFTSITGGIRQTDISFEDQAQSLDTDYFSIDASKTINGWEIAKLLVGGRYIDYGETYNYSGITRSTASDFPGGTAPADRVVENVRTEAFRSEVENRMVGMQIGLDLLYPISRFAYSDMRMRAGAYANFAESNFVRTGTSTPTVTTGTPLVTDIPFSLDGAGGDDDVALSGMFEFGTGIRYQVGEILSLRAGVELWYLASGAAATDNGNVPNGPISINEDVLFTGLSFGSELRW